MAHGLMRLRALQRRSSTQPSLSSTQPSLLHLLQQPNKTKPTSTTINNKRNICCCCCYVPRRHYISDMRKEAFEGNILRLLRNEIRYEFERSPPFQPVPEFNSFMVDDRPGEQWIRLTRKFADNEEIKVEVTMFDGSIPSEKPGGVTTDEDVRLHITIIVDIFKGEGNNVLEFVCSAWEDSIEIRKVYTRTQDRMTGQLYMGPGFKELDDELQNSLYDFLAERGVDDDLGTFLHQYMKNKDKTEYIRWMERVKHFVEKK